ncbi:MAG TPA: VWA domain-containing protein [Terracidiphilus sp.]|nr:VWA domain-containing protein [Terracidiphilus sp.]
MSTPRRSVPFARYLSIAMLLIAVAVLAISPAARVQAQSSSQQTQKPDQASPDSGGPGGDNGVIVVPKRKEAPEEPPPPPAPAAPKLKNPEGMGNVSIRLEVPEVTVDVGVLLEKTHQFVPGLKPQNFKVYEDGIEQKVIGFKRVEAPVTALMLCEFASNGYWWIKGNDMINAAYAFTQQLRPQDYVALMTFDMHTQIITDFTQDKQQILQGLQMLQIPGFSETNVFDALYESLDRLDRIEGQKYILLIATGRDTFSKLTFDKILARVKASRNITIFTVSTGGMLRAMTEGRGGMEASIRDMDYLQADNEMKTFANLTGGMSFFPRFEGEMPDIFQNINQNIRAKYEILYRPTNDKQDGTYRKLRVTLVDDEGQPLRFQDQKKKPLKYDIIARDGYRARQQVE